MTEQDNHFDVIVVGIGAMGSAACYYLSRAGARVMGIEQFGITHEKGSYSGQSRIIRKAYFEHPDYVPVLEKAYENWRAIENELKEKLFYETGLVYFGRRNSTLLEGVRRSAEKYDLNISGLNVKEAGERFPQFILPDDFEGIVEPEAGFVLSDKTIRVLTDAARSRGAVIHTHEKVGSWELYDRKVTVKTDRATYRANRLILSTGAYTAELSEYVKQKLTVTRQLISWVKPTTELDFEAGKFPCWIIEVPGQPGGFYGFPLLSSPQFEGPVGLKVAHHARGPAIAPEKIREFDTGREEKKIEDFLRSYIPNGFQRFLSMKSCLYTYSPDGHFIIDFLPETNRQVVLASGFSGHGFKFVPVIGEILCDLALDGQTGQPVKFLSLDRI